MEDTQFIDAENYHHNQERITFRDIVLLHLKKISTYAGVEWCGGYWNERIKPVGNGVISEKYYVPDTREVYCNAVDYLADILYPHFDEKMTKAEEELNKKLDKLYKDYSGEKSFDKQNYRQDKTKIKRKLFRELCSFLRRKTYFDSIAIEE